MNTAEVLDIFISLLLLVLDIQSSWYNFNTQHQPIKKRRLQFHEDLVYVVQIFAMRTKETLRLSLLGIFAIWYKRQHILGSLIIFAKPINLLHTKCDTLREIPYVYGVWACAVIKDHPGTDTHLL